MKIFECSLFIRIDAYSGEGGVGVCGDKFLPSRLFPGGRNTDLAGHAHAGKEAFISLCGSMTDVLIDRRRRPASAGGKASGASENAAYITCDKEKPRAVPGLRLGLCCARSGSEIGPNPTRRFRCYVAGTALLFKICRANNTSNQRCRRVANQSSGFEN